MYWEQNGSYQANDFRDPPLQPAVSNFLYGHAHKVHYILDSIVKLSIASTERKV